MKLPQSLTSLLTFGACVAFAPPVFAEELWDNGEPNNAGVVNGQYESAMDDFYAPDAGWWISSAQADGIFMNAGSVVDEDDVQVRIWAHDYDENVPDGDNVTALNVTSVNVIATGEDWYDHERLTIEVEFDNHFLQGQEYYWIEFIVEDQLNRALLFLARQPVTHETAHTRDFGSPEAAANVDMSFKLSGTDIELAHYFAGGNDQLTYKGLDNSPLVTTLFVPVDQKVFKQGYYQIKMTRKGPQLEHFGRDSRALLDFKPNPVKEQRLHTPAGDDLCPQGEGSLAQYCQQFVACAVYDLFCY